MAANQTTSAQTTFAVDPVKQSRELLPTVRSHVSIEKLGSSIEACDTYHVDVVQQPSFHSLIAEAHLAYQHHLPLLLSPDMLWLIVAQGLANHVNTHAESLLKQRVRQEAPNAETSRKKKS